MKKLIWLVAVPIVIVIIILALSRSVQDNTIKLGFVGPLTGFGADFGEESKIAVAIAVEEINANGGISGKKVSVIYEDGKCGAKDAITSAQKLISVEKVKVIMSVCGQESLAIAPIAEKNKVLMMALWSTHPKLTGVGEYIFRNAYSDEDTGKSMAQEVARRYDSVAIMTELNEYSIGLRDIFEKYFKGKVIEENYSPGTKDFKSYILDILSNKPQAVVMNPSSAADGLVALRQLRQLGFKGQLYGNYFGSVNDVLQSPEAQGMVFFTDPVVRDNVLRESLYAKFQSTTDRKPNYDFAVAISYDSVYILRQAIANVGTDPSKLKDYLHSMKDFIGVMGTYGFNDWGDATGYVPSMKQIKNGRVVDVAE
ncbi:MAG: ABC transporter substrate-binding protein [Candidatus Paceibacterota bacterium]